MKEPTVRRRQRLAAALVSCILLAAACGSGGATDTRTLTVSAAASLRVPFTAIGDDVAKANPGVRDVRFSFDSSATLARQIREGAPADVFASADEATMKTLTDAGLTAGAPVVFARNALTIVVKKGNPRNVRSLADLATVGTVSLCGADVPCGRYSDESLRKAGVTIPVDRITRGQDVTATFTAVSEGDADAGIVYVTDVRGDRTDSVAIPTEHNVIATYPIAVIASSPDQARARAFVDHVVSPSGQARLRAAGFLPPS